MPTVHFAPRKLLNGLGVYPPRKIDGTPQHLFDFAHAPRTPHSASELDSDSSDSSSSSSSLSESSDSESSWSGAESERPGGDDGSPAKENRIHHHAETRKMWKDLVSLCGGEPSNSQSEEGGTLCSESSDGQVIMTDNRRKASDAEESPPKTNGTNDSSSAQDEG